MKSSIKIIVKSFQGILWIILIFLFSSALYSQPERSRLKSGQDTTLSEKTDLSAVKQDTIFVMEKSPWLAMVQSAVIPGLGQIYNESYIKAPIIWGVSALLVYGWIYNDDLYRDYQELAIQNPTDYIRFRNFYRDQRDLFTIYLGLVYLLNLVDAYVDAHLFDFNVEEDFFTKMPMLNLKVNF